MADTIIGQARLGGLTIGDLTFQECFELRHYLGREVRAAGHRRAQAELRRVSVGVRLTPHRRVGRIHEQIQGTHQIAKIRTE